MLLMYKNFAPWQWAVNFIPVLAGITIKAVFFTKKKLVDELNRKYNSNIQLDDNPINVRDALIYGYGRLIGINIYDRYVDDKKDILKRFDNFMNQYTLVGTFDSIDVLGISKDDLISNKVLKRTLKEYKIKYDDYIVRNRK